MNAYFIPALFVAALVGAWVRDQYLAYAARCEALNATPEVAAPVAIRFVRRGELGAQNLN